MHLTPTNPRGGLDHASRGDDGAFPNVDTDGRCFASGL